ncbi:hypothetical protein Syun_014985 [Stephania yunnanensis]|uniref:Homeobox domain-containing protein n=1 Tax=Stephania yunnanensis TaxID=152371 RepID=A0AAP0PCD2_9MAGN
MDYEMLEQQQQQQQQQMGKMLYMKVMTEEQMEVLRWQISAYGTICERLVEMHKTMTAQQDLSGTRLGNPYCDSLMASAGHIHKFPARQRWTPTPVQLQILEGIFDEGNGTPTKQKIKEITNELMQHGQVSETNVYNWFQNRRARSKRKQVGAAHNNAESEQETEVESPKEKKVKSDNELSNEKSAPRMDNVCFPSSEMSSEVHLLDVHKTMPTYPSGGCSQSSGSLGQIPFCQGMSHMMNQMEASGSSQRRHDMIR